MNLNVRIALRKEWDGVLITLSITISCNMVCPLILELSFLPPTLHRFPKSLMKPYNIQSRIKQFAMRWKRLTNIEHGPVDYKWIFAVKHKANDIVERYRTRRFYSVIWNQTIKKHSHKVQNSTQSGYLSHRLWIQSKNQIPVSSTSGYEKGILEWRLRRSLFEYSMWVWGWSNKHASLQTQKVTLWTKTIP